MSELRIAFVGFRHGHINSLYQLAGETDGVRIVGACEEHADTRASLPESIEVTHQDAERLLADVECDIVAVGDAFGLRGARAIAALEASRHVIVDKPLCTRLTELERIRELSSQQDLQVGCMLTMRDSATTVGARQLIADGAIGEVHAIQFGGQHPLMYGSRANWYWEPDMHGGTINDIGIHAFDSIPLITGQKFARIDAARCWNAFARDVPHFHDGAQLMMTMDNGCGVIGDVSYHAPDASGYRMPYYWRTTFWGTDGVLETSSNYDHIALTTSTGSATEQRPLPEGNKGGYFRSFLKCIRGETLADTEPSTHQVLASSELALRVQAAADEHQVGVELT